MPLSRLTTTNPYHHLSRLVSRYPQLKGGCEKAVSVLFEAMVACFEGGGKLLVCGNGGSAADAEHIAGELLKGFLKKRHVRDERLGDHAARLQGAFPVIALTGHPALATAFLNDVDPYMVFAQQVYAYGRTDDLFLGISTSGDSRNVVAAAEVAKALGLKCAALTGETGGALKAVCEYTVAVPARHTPDVQELHLPVYHCLCAMLEEAFFED
jgi:D-sedoheptulose 7-phosphate isomerase